MKRRDLIYLVATKVTSSYKIQSVYWMVDDLLAWKVNSEVPADLIFLVKRKQRKETIWSQYTTCDRHLFMLLSFNQK